MLSSTRGWPWKETSPTIDRHNHSAFQDSISRSNGFAKQSNVHALTSGNGLHANIKLIQATTTPRSKLGNIQKPSSYTGHIGTGSGLKSYDVSQTTANRQNRYALTGNSQTTPKAGQPVSSNGFQQGSLISEHSTVQNNLAASDSSYITRNGFDHSSHGLHQAQPQHINNAAQPWMPSYTTEKIQNASIFDSDLTKPFSDLEISGPYQYNQPISRATAKPYAYDDGAVEDTQHQSNLKNRSRFGDQHTNGYTDYSNGRRIPIHEVASYGYQNNYSPAPGSPSMSDFRPNFRSPFDSNAGTPPTADGSSRSASQSGLSSRTSIIAPVVPERSIRCLPSLQTSSITPNPLNRYQYHPQSSFNPLAIPYQSQQYQRSTFAQGRVSSREHEYNLITRSVLLEDFRTNLKTNRRYELKVSSPQTADVRAITDSVQDIYDHIVEFSGDQHGSRFIQQKLETANSDEKEQIFLEIQTNSLQLMTDVFGNYVIQKLFEHGSQAQKKTLANQMRGHVMTLSLQMYGCRVVQKALEHILTDQQATLVKELEPNILKAVKDQHGNHVVQKAIERVPQEHIQFMVTAFQGQVHRLGTHPFGCRVIQRMLEYCQEPARQSILRELHDCIPQLTINDYGNYVIQHILENGDSKDKNAIVDVVISNAVAYSKEKFASNVVEKSMKHGAEYQKSEIIRVLTTASHGATVSPVLSLMRDQYGNYVIQKVFETVKGQERDVFMNEQVKPALMEMRRIPYFNGTNNAKQIVAMEKLASDYDCEMQLNSSRSASSQDSNLPSTNSSTIEGPVTMPPPAFAHEMRMPQIQIGHVGMRSMGNQN